MTRGPEWAAGILEGEGSFMVKASRRVRVSATMTDRDVLEELQRILGGSLREARSRADHHKAAWTWGTTSNIDSLRVIREVEPYVMSRRREAIEKCLAVLAEVAGDHAAARAHRLTRDDEVRRLRSEGASVTEVARHFGLSRQVTSEIVNHGHHLEAWRARRR